MASPDETKNPNADQDTIKLLIQTCKRGQQQILQSLLKEDSSARLLISYKDKNGTTPLHEACYFGLTECIKILLANGADACILDDNGYAPIHCATYNNHRDAVKILLDTRSCNFDIRSRKHETALHIACMRSHTNLARDLTERCANTMAVTCRLDTPLHYAASSDCGELVESLLEHTMVKQTIDQVNKLGQSAAHQAVSLGCIHSVSSLKFHGANFHLKDSCGRSALDIAEGLSNVKCLDIASGRAEPIRTPIERKAHPGTSGSRVPASGHNTPLQQINRQDGSPHSLPAIPHTGTTGMDQPRVGQGDTFFPSLPTFRIGDSPLMSEGIRTRPALNDLSAEVKEVSDWHQLGLYLGIDSTSLDTIQTKYPNVGNTRWRNEVLSEWLRKEENASWEDVINALNQMGEKRIALRIRKKYGVHSQQSAEPVFPGSTPTTSRHTPHHFQQDDTDASRGFSHSIPNFSNNQSSGGTPMSRFHFRFRGVRINIDEAEVDVEGPAAAVSGIFSQFSSSNGTPPPGTPNQQRSSRSPDSDS